MNLNGLTSLGIPQNGSSTVTVGKDRRTLTVRQEDGRDDLNTVSVLERRNLSHGAENRFVQWSSTESEVTGAIHHFTTPSVS